jgi:hypothetical protein
MKQSAGPPAMVLQSPKNMPTLSLQICLHNGRQFLKKLHGCCDLPFEGRPIAMHAAYQGPPRSWGGPFLFVSGGRPLGNAGTDT